MTFDLAFNLGNVITVLVTFAGGLWALALIAARSSANREAIAQLRADLEKEIGIVHRRYDRHTVDLSDSIKALAIEMRAMHAENMRFREQVAREYVTDDKLASVLAQIHNDLSSIAKRMDGFVDRKPQP